MPSLILGSVSLVILLVAKKLVPKFPMAVVLMVLGAVLTNMLPMTAWGIKTLDAVEPGLPKWNIPDFTVVPIREVITISLSVAVVIMAETLLAENNFAQKNRYRINDNQEILAFAAGNMAAAFTGCCPINGSVSRTAMGEQYQGKTQVMSIVAGLSMLILLLCGTGFIGYLPIPVLTAIVISALLGATEFHLAAKLWKVSRTEFFIFAGAFVGVLFLGTINGVLIGIILSFSESTNVVKSNQKMIWAIIINIIVVSLLITLNMFIPDNRYFLVGIFCLMVITSSALLYQIIKKF
jgi:sulfate permease, SulP family